VDRLQLQLAEVRAHSRDLKTQLADAADYKVPPLFSFCFMEYLFVNYIDSFKRLWEGGTRETTFVAVI